MARARAHPRQQGVDAVSAVLDGDDRVSDTRGKIVVGVDTSAPGWRRSER
jgi:hypothetical protein